MSCKLVLFSPLNRTFILSSMSLLDDEYGRLDGNWTGVESGRFDFEINVDFLSIADLSNLGVKLKGELDSGKGYSNAIDWISQYLRKFENLCLGKCPPWPSPGHFLEMSALFLSPPQMAYKYRYISHLK